uniref:Uncharacterized protein n=1 Tax=Oryza sativa subsp. japonica TaxID=39947 RepID=Q2QZZ9_ORYSJ|nr:hypothetical protein LOC_Os11g44270 [Oryza sativa Japonica Group]
MSCSTRQPSGTGTRMTCKIVPATVSNTFGASWCGAGGSRTRWAGTDARFASPPPNLEENLGVDHDDDTPLRFHTVDSLLGEAAAPGFAIRELEITEELLLSTPTNPQASRKRS